MTTALALKLSVSSPLWEHFSRDNQLMQKKQYGKSGPKDPSEIGNVDFQILLSKLSRQRCPTLPPVRSHEAARVFASWQLVPRFHQVVISGNCCNMTHTDYVKSHMNTKRNVRGFCVSFHSDFTSVFRWWGHSSIKTPDMFTQVCMYSPILGAI